MIRQRKPIRRTPLARKRTPRPPSTLREFLNADKFTPAKFKRKMPKHRPRRNVVHVELNAAGQVEVVIRNCNQKSCGHPNAIHRDRTEAVGELRQRVYERSQGKCEHLKLMVNTAIFATPAMPSPGGMRPCGKPTAWDDGELHERVHRGQGGKISMINSEWACRECHRNAHQDRAPRLKWLK